MQHDEFVGQVQHRAQLASRGEAEQAIRAALETLGERITAGLAENLAAQLPPEIGEHLRRTEGPSAQDTGERFDLSTFANRVSGRGGVDEQRAIYLSRVVLEVVGEATQGNVMTRVHDHLPADIQQLLEAGSTGKLST